jgi:hypothetical protein
MMRGNPAPLMEESSWESMARNMEKEWVSLRYLPVKALDDLDALRRNVYDAILTESVRTIHYKSPMPEKKEFVSKLVEIAEHYANLIEQEEDHV